MEETPKGKAEVMSLRLNPKLKFELETLSKLEDKSIAQIMVAALNAYLDNQDNWPKGSRRELDQYVWDIYPQFRTLRKMFHPAFNKELTLQEEVILRNIISQGKYWHDEKPRNWTERDNLKYTDLNDIVIFRDWSKLKTNQLNIE